MTKLVPWVVGLGLVLIPIHRMTPLITSLGYLFLFIGLTWWLTVTLKTRQLPKVNWCFLTPMLAWLVITLVQLALDKIELYPVVFLVALITIYLMSTSLNSRAFFLLGGLGVVLAISVAINGVQGIRSGGILHQFNYNIATAVLFLSLALTKWKHKYLLAAILIPGALLTGAENAVLATGVTAGYIIFARDYSRRLLPLIAVLVILITAGIATGKLQELYWTIPDRISYLIGKPTNPEVDNATEERITNYQLAIQHSNIIGQGYGPTEAKGSSIHSVPLKILDELGLVGLLAWLWIVLYGMFRTKWHYSFLMILTLSLFDNLIWTQLTPYLFIIAGVATAYPKQSDRLFSL